jgi:hypothetical protein
MTAPNPVGVVLLLLWALVTLAVYLREVGRG